MLGVNSSLDQEIILDNLLSLTLDLETPSCVIQEAGLTRGIKVAEKRLQDEGYRANVIRTILSTKPYSVSKNFNDYDLQKIARYVNPQDVDWDEDTLLEAFNFLEEVRCNLDNNKKPSYKGFGYCTPCKKEQLSCLVVYKYVKLKGVRTRHSHSFEDLISVFECMNRNRESLYSLLISSLADVNEEGLSSLILESRQLPKSEKKDLNKVSSIISSMTNLKKNRIYPQSQEEAISLLVTDYNIDSTTMENPCMFLHCLRTGEEQQDSYVKSLLKIDSNMYSITTRFNPFFPKSVYTLQLLKNFCERVPIVKHPRLDTNYANLVATEQFDAFKMGFYPGADLQTKIYEEEVSKENLDQFITYGSFCTKFELYTIEELSQMFSEYGRFLSVDGTVFSNKSILTLTNLVKRQARREQKKRIYGIYGQWTRFYSVILDTQEVMTSIPKKKQEFIDYHCSLTSQDQQKLVKVLYHIFYFALKCRGWKEGQPWPIVTERATTTNDIRAELMEEEIPALTEILNYEDPICKYVMSLPLIGVDTKNKMLYVVTSQVDGLSMQDRLRIVYENKTEAACIRTSSTFFIATCFTFLDSVGGIKQQREDFLEIKITI